MRTFLIALIAVVLCLPLQAQRQPTEREKELGMRLMQAQASGDDAVFYQAQKEYMDYLESVSEWERYYNTWSYSVVYEVNHKHFHRAYTDILNIIEDINERDKEQYLYIPNMMLGLFYVSRNQPEMGEQYFRRALNGIDTEKNPVATFNAYLSLSQSLSFNKPAEAMACLDSLPKAMLANPLYESGVLGYRCIIAHVAKDREAFDRYYAQYDSIRRNLPEQFNATNLHQVMVSRCLFADNYEEALAWCDSIDVDLTATELRVNVYEQMGDWERAYRAFVLKDSMIHAGDLEVLEENLTELTHDIDLLQAERDRSEMQHRLLWVISLLAVAVITLLVALLVIRYNKNRRLRRQYEQLQEMRRNTQAAQAIRRAFVGSIEQMLKSPINVLRGYSRIFNDPDFRLDPDQRRKRYTDIATAARTVESLLEPLYDSYSHGSTGITDEQKKICQNALRSPLQTLIGMADMIADSDGQIPHDEYMQMRVEIGRTAYHVATSAHALIMFSLTDDETEVDKSDSVGLNETMNAALNSYDLRNHDLGIAFESAVADDVKILTNQSLMQELLNCLLDNLDKHAKDGLISMHCRAEADGKHTVTLSNQGEPITAENADRIFEPFVRLSEEAESLGIGLALARRLAVSMGYTITIDTTYTDGVCFVVSGI